MKMEVNSNFVKIFILLIFGCGTNQLEEFDTIIGNVNLIDGTGAALKQNVNVYIKDGLIGKIDSVKLAKNSYSIDGSGKYLMPGLFDCHVHTSYQKDFPRFIHFGVTSIFVTGGSLCTNEYYEEMRSLGNQDSIPAPRVFHTSQHFTMEGSHPVKTYHSSNWEEGKTVHFLRDTFQIEHLVKNVASQPIIGIKLTIEDGPHPPFVKRMPQEFINKVQIEAEKNDLEVFAHVSDNTELEMAIKANIKNLVHFTGVDFDFERDRVLLTKIYEDSINWVTTLMLDKSFQYPLHPEWIEVDELQNVFDKEEFASMNDEFFTFRANAYITFMKEYLNTDSIGLEETIKFQVDDIKVLIDHGVNMTLGTDTGNKFIFSGYSLHEEMQLLELGGIKPIEIIKMGTLNAAKMLKVDKNLGSIEIGKAADMILLNRNPLELISNSLTIHTVFKNGAIQQSIKYDH